MKTRNLFYCALTLVALLAVLLPQGVGIPARIARADGPITFTKHIVDSNFNTPEVGYATDLDRDGDVDILGTSYYGATIAWWENDGSQSFAKHIIDSGFGRARTAYAADVDGDEDIDVLGASAWGGIAWWENDGSQAFTKHTINDHVESDGARCVFATDLDKDGDVDILGTANLDGFHATYWWENDGDENFSEHTVNDTSISSCWADAADMDDDGDVDVLTAGGANISWWENDGGENFSEHIVDDTLDNAARVVAVDMDDDGDMDVLGTDKDSDEIAWWENNGAEVFTKHIVADALGPRHTCPADLDSDGDVDILGAVTDANTIAWWENDGAENFAQHTVDDQFNHTLYAEAVDIDKDGDLDILGSAYLLNDIAWWENTGGAPGEQCIHVTTVLPPSDGIFLPIVFRNYDGSPSPPWTGPTIREVTEDTGGCLKFVGDMIHFTVDTGETGGTATVDIGDVHKGIGLYDDGTHGDTTPGDGVYELDYVTTASDIARTVKIVGHFTSAAGQSAPLARSEGRVTIADWESGESSVDGGVSLSSIVENPDGVKYVGNRFVISFVLGTSWEEVTSTLIKHNLKLASWLPKIWAFEVELEEGQDLETVRLQLLNEPTVEAVDYSILGQLDDPPTVIYDDEIIAQMDYLNTIRAKLGWKITKGVSSVRVGILDTGIDSDHSDLQSQIWVWYQEDYEDETGHGTAVAGIIAAEDENEGISGVAPNVGLAIGRSLKGTDEEDFLWLSASDLLIRMADSGVKVVNMSWGQYTSIANTKYLSNAIDLAYQENVVLVASAGNEPREMIKADRGLHGKEVHYPSSYTKVLAVGATEKDDRRWDHSAWGDQVIYAPGVSICTTVMGGDYGGEWLDPAGLCSDGDGLDGTSFAAPQVAALAALICSVDPDLENWKVTNLITSTADHPTGLGGLGRINVYRALQVANGQGDPDEDPLPLALESLEAEHVADATGHYVRLTWTAPTTDYVGADIYREDKASHELVHLNGGPVSGTEYEDRAIDETWYNYYAFSVDDLGQESAAYVYRLGLDTRKQVTMDQVYTTDYWGNPKDNDTFRPGEAILLVLEATNHGDGPLDVTYDWDVYDPTGAKVSYLSWNDWAVSMPPGESIRWLTRGIASNATLGTYTYTATVSYASGTSAGSKPFTVQDEPVSINLLEALTCKDVQNDLPVDVTSTFTTNDAYVYAWTAWEGASGAHTILWEWYRPNGTLFGTYSYDFNTTYSLYYVWSWLSVSCVGDDLGQWSVRFYMDGAYKGTRYFTIGAGTQSQTDDQLQLSIPEAGAAGGTSLPVQPASAPVEAEGD